MTTDRPGEPGVLRELLRMGLPSMAGFAATNVYDLIDMFWLARLGITEVAAVTVYFSVHWVLGSANQVVGTGSVALISRRYGEGDAGRTEAAIKEALVLKAAVALLCTLIGLALLPAVLGLLGADGEMHRQATSYGTVQLLGLVATWCAFTVFTALRGISQPRTAMVLMLMGTVLNIALDPLLIFGWGPIPRMGVVGAAAASVISWTLTFAAGLAVLYGGWATVRLHVRGAVPLSRENMRRMLRIGFPSSINSLSLSASRAAIMPLIAVYGAGVLAAYGMAQRVGAFGIMVVAGLGLGLSALTGQNLGAGRPERARRTADLGIGMCGVFMALFGAITFVAARPIAGAFFDDPEVVAAGVIVLRILAFSLPMVGVIIAMETACAGAGHTRMPMVYGLIHAWLLQIPLILLMGKALELGPAGIWSAIVIASVLGAAAFGAWYRRGSWLT